MNTSLINKNHKLVFFVANKYRYTSVPFDALVSAGNSGLLSAAKNFDPNKGKFSTIACKSIRCKILSEIEQHIIDWKKYTSLSPSCAAGEEEQETSSTESRIQTDNFLEFEKEPVTKYEIEKLLECLNERERIIIERHFFEGFTFAEIARDFKLTRAGVCVIKDKALDKLKKRFERVKNRKPV